MERIRAKVEVLSEDEIEAIHRATLEVLETVGCRLPHARVLERLAEAEAEVDRATGCARLPAELVERALAALSGGRRITPEAKYQRSVVRDGRVRIGVSTQANIVDYGARQRRRGTTEDVLKGIVLCNELPHVGSAMPLVVPSDVPPHMADVYGYALCALYSRKPYGAYILSREAARLIQRIAEIRSGGQKPHLCYLLEPNGALSYDEFSLEMAVMFAEEGHAFALGPMAMMGLDAPVTYAGTLVMQNAYNLIGNVIAWLWDVPGSWGGSAHSFDLRSGLCSFGSPNQILLGLAAVQIGNWYGFECGANCALTDACVPDFQAGFEKGASVMAMLLAGAGYGAQGIVGADQGVSLEQLVIDDEWASAMEHIFSRGVAVTPETLGVEAIRRVGILGSFLSDPHTLAHLRDTQWASTLFNYECWDAWMARGGKDVYARAHERVQQILSQHYPPALQVSEPVAAAIHSVLEEARAHPERFRGARYEG